MSSRTGHRKNMNKIKIFKNVIFNYFFLWSKQCNDMKKYKIHKTFLGGSQEGKDLNLKRQKKSYLSICKETKISKRAEIKLFRSRLLIFSYSAPHTIIGVICRCQHFS